MTLVRRVDREANALQRQGELGIWVPLLGQEAAQVGAGRALKPGDMAFPSYREHGVAWCRGIDPTELLGIFRGTDQGSWDPRTTGFHLYTIVIGNQCLNATGYAMGQRFEGKIGGPRRAGHDVLLRRRRHQPGRRARGLRLGGRLRRPGRLLLPEQPVGDLRADRAPDPGAALPPRPGLRLPGRPRRRQRRARLPGREPLGAGGVPHRQRPRADRGVHLPDGRPHDLRRPVALPAGRRAGAVEAQGPDRAGAGAPRARARRRAGVLRRRRRRGRRAGRAAAGVLPGDARPGPERIFSQVYAEPSPVLDAQRDAYLAYTHLRGWRARGDVHGRR